MTTQLLNHASTPVLDGNLTPAGYQQITGLSTVKSLTVPNGARLALIQAEAQNVRYRDDGTDPDANTGMLVASGSDVWYIGDLSAVRLIETTASAKVNVSYYK